MPVNYKRDYPANWKEISARILERDRHRCRQCGVKNYAVGVRTSGGDFHAYNSDEVIIGKRDLSGLKIFKIILTCANLNHNMAGKPGYHDDDNLAMLCQFHHLNLDARYKANKRKGKK